MFDNTVIISQHGSVVNRKIRKNILYPKFVYKADLKEHKRSFLLRAQKIIVLHDRCAIFRAIRS